MLTFYSAPIFDFSESLSNSELCDCTLILNNEEIRAHRLILANASRFFENVFTAEMVESHTSRVEISPDPGGLFRKVLDYLYSGRIEIADHEIVPLIYHATHYSISELKKCLIEKLESELTLDRLLELIRQAYNEELQQALDVLVEYAPRFYWSVPISVWSNALDINSFCSVLSNVEMSVGDRVATLNEFLGNHRPNEHEKKRMDELIMGYEGPVRPSWH
jgi:hypothetical protein